MFVFTPEDLHSIQISHQEIEISANFKGNLYQLGMWFMFQDPIQHFTPAISVSISNICSNNFS
jgi:hypothetical protein